MDDSHLSVSLTQQSFAEIFEILIQQACIYLTPNCSGLPIDPALNEEVSSTNRDALCLQYKSSIGTFIGWLILCHA
jgi:hypothetical protein